MSTHENRIELAGNTLVSGDEVSIKVVFANLTGKNFANPPSWKTQTHGQWLAMMEKEWDVSLAPGQTATLFIGDALLESVSLTASPDYTQALPVDPGLSSDANQDGSHANV